MSMLDQTQRLVGFLMTVNQLTRLDTIKEPSLGDQEIRWFAT